MLLITSVIAARPEWAADPSGKFSIKNSRQSKRNQIDLEVKNQDFIYNIGYMFQDTSWEPFTFSEPTLQDSQWISAKATKRFDWSDSETSEGMKWVVTYGCSRKGNNWDCNENKWMLQSFTIDQCGEEICDGIDNDCDDIIDEDCPCDTTLSGECTESGQRCTNGKESEDSTCEASSKCAEGTSEQQCSESRPLFCQNGALLPNPSLCGCPNNKPNLCGFTCEEPCADHLEFKCKGNVPNCVSIDCEDETKSGECSQRSGQRCMKGNLINDITCGANQCTDGTALNTCSSNRPKFCDDKGILIDDPEQCGCPNNLPNLCGTCNEQCPQNQEFKCTDETPECVTTSCEDGTVIGSCASAPMMCDQNGQLIINTERCGCPLGSFTCKDGCFDQCPSNEEFDCETKTCKKTSCEDGTKVNECSTSFPEFCDATGTLQDNIDKCGCGDKLICDTRCVAKCNADQEFLCTSSIGECYDKECSDGTSLEQCSEVIPGNRCRKGFLISDATCKVTEILCEDGTKAETCKDTMYCNAEGVFVEDAIKCGCPDKKQACGATCGTCDEGYDFNCDNNQFYCTEKACGTVAHGQCSEEKKGFICDKGELVKDDWECGPELLEWEFCRDNGPCDLKEGDCNDDSECKEGLACLKGIAENFYGEEHDTKWICGPKSCKDSNECPEEYKKKCEKPEYPFSCGNACWTGCKDNTYKTVPNCNNQGENVCCPVEEPYWCDTLEKCSASQTCTETCQDGIKNQDETDIDCGGTCNKCEENKDCEEDTDCLSNDCDWDTEKCISPCVPTEEICDEKDNNCDGKIDEICDKDKDEYADATIKCEGGFIDGYGLSGSCERWGGDCDDTNNQISPSMNEICDDNIDNNCDGNKDENCECVEGECSINQGFKRCVNNKLIDDPSCSCIDSDTENIYEKGHIKTFWKNNDNEIKTEIFEDKCSDNQFLDEAICEPGIDHTFGINGGKIIDNWAFYGKFHYEEGLYVGFTDNTFSEVNIIFFGETKTIKETQTANFPNNVYITWKYLTVKSETDVYAHFEYGHHNFDLKSNNCKFGCADEACLKTEDCNNDGIKNGMETDVDCGRLCNKKCDAGEICDWKYDCESNDCNHDTHKCSEVLVKYYLDADGDTYGTTSSQQLTGPSGNYRATRSGDCKDDNTNINPGKTEVCGDNLDNNCANGVDENCATKKTYYLDEDGDTYGTTSSQQLTAPSGNYRATRSGDCKDDNTNINPGKSEVCYDNIDNNCRSGVDENCAVKKTYYLDADRDSYGTTSSQQLTGPSGNYRATRSGDCRDDNANINPSEREVCGDNLDSNCKNGNDDGCRCTDSDPSGRDENNRNTPYNMWKKGVTTIYSGAYLGTRKTDICNYRAQDDANGRTSQRYLIDYSCSRNTMKANVIDCARYGGWCYNGACIGTNDNCARTGNRCTSGKTCQGRNGIYNCR